MRYARLFIATALLAHVGIAAADTDETAEAASKRARSAMKAGRIHEACQAYEESDRLEARVETELSLAGCYEEDGKPVAAARLYRSVADKDANASRKQTSLAKAAKLEAKAPKLRFAINPMPPGLVVKVDGLEVPAKGDVLVDTGPHEVIATAPGYAGHASAPVDRERVIVDVVINMEPVAEAAPAPAAKVAEPAAAAAAVEPAPEAMAQPMPAPRDTGTASSSDHRTRNALILGAGGAALVAGAAVMFKLSADKYDDERALCPSSQCATPADLDRAKSLVSDGRTLRGASYGLGIGGAALIGAGVYLLLTPHRHESNLAVQVEPGHAGVTYSATF